MLSSPLHWGGGGGGGEANTVVTGHTLIIIYCTSRSVAHKDVQILSGLCLALALIIIQWCIFGKLKLIHRSCHKCEYCKCSFEMTLLQWGEGGGLHIVLPRVKEKGVSNGELVSGK